MTKILHIPNFYMPHTGGIEDVCNNVVDIIKSDNSFEQQIICFSASDKSVTETIKGITVHRIGSIIKVASQHISTSYFFALKRVIKEFNPDFIHFHYPNPLVAAYLLHAIKPSCKLILHWHSDIVDQKRLYNFVKGIEKCLIDRADKIIVTSPDYLNGSKPLQHVHNKSIVIPNVIRTERLEETSEVKAKVSEIKSQYNNKKIVLFVGRHVPYKGLKYLIDAASYIKSDCVILIGGSGPQTESLKSLNKDSKVHFIGHIPDQELTAYYYAADIFAFPSITKNEAFGVALAEAMYCNTPAVTFTINGSGVNWVNINGVTGTETKTKDGKLYAESIDNLLSNDALRLTYAKQARERVDELFVPERIISKVFDLYK